MKNKDKIPAFTLSEVLIVLVITSIVVGIAFAVLHLVTKQFNTMSNRYDERIQTQKLKQQIAVDLDSGQSIILKDDEEKLQIINDDNLNANYEWAGDYLIRNKDTLSKTLKTIRFYYLGTEVTAGQVDGIELELKSFGRSLRLFTSKKVDSKKQLSDLWD